MIEQRKHPRFKVAVPVEVHAEGAAASLHGATSDLSLDRCYIESMYPFPAGTCLGLKLDACDTLLITAKVVTCDPQFGKGIQFIRMLDDDGAGLGKFLAHMAHPDLASAHGA